MWKTNYCQTTDYQELEMQECLDLYPQVLYDFLTINRSVVKYEKLKKYWGVRTFRRFLIIFAWISRLGMAPLPPFPLWLLFRPGFSMPPGWPPPGFRMPPGWPPPGFGMPPNFPGISMPPGWPPPGLAVPPGWPNPSWNPDI
ncbi:uncharacterized protein LOC124359439 isoform X2 [Homalodisca vitripennis]|nr:uncharacterized protein LOC124359439 isoform X2 [Homalodisca vitripennis]